MSIYVPPTSIGTSSFGAAQGASEFPNRTTPSDQSASATQASGENHDAVQVGTDDVHSTLELGRRQSEEAVNQAQPEGLEQVLSPEEVERRIVSGKMALIHTLADILSQNLAEELVAEGMERIVNSYIDMEWAGLTGVSCLAALEEIALAELLTLWGAGSRPLSATLQNDATPAGELVFRLIGEPTEADNEQWDESLDARDEVLLRLAGTSGSAQTFMNGERVANLRQILLNTAARDERRLESELATVRNGGLLNLNEGEAQKVLRILDSRLDAAFDRAHPLVKVAKLDEVALEVLGFTPLRRSCVDTHGTVLTPVAAEVPAEAVINEEEAVLTTE